MFRASGKCSSGLFVFVVRAIALCVTVSCVVSFLTTNAFTQATDTSQIDAYLKAITQADTTARLSALERFAALPPSRSREISEYALTISPSSVAFVSVQT